MRAAVISDRKVHAGTAPDAVAADGQLLIHVRAAGINAADVAQVAGGYPPPPGTPPDIPGLECAGETDDGRRVMALLPGAGQAELVAVDARHVLDVPPNIPWAEAGAFVEVYATAHDALFAQAALRAGERLLVNGAAGGVGSAAVQLGVAAGAQVTANARHHHDELRALGADTNVDGRYDVILELVGGENLATNLDRLARHGRVAIIGLGAGSTQAVDFRKLMTARGRIHGSTLRYRSADEKAAVVDRLRDEVVPLLADGRVRVLVDRAFALDDVGEAYRHFSSPGKHGKVVLTI